VFPVRYELNLVWMHIMLRSVTMFHCVTLMPYECSARSATIQLLREEVADY
jgi:hypothetical protein